MITDELIKQVWQNGTIVPGFDPDTFRKDACGAWILRNYYGTRDSSFGWEIDHVYPVALGGGDDLQNLRPMQWENNVSKGDDYPSYKSKIQSDGNKNVYKEEQFSVNSKLQKTISSLYDI